MLRLTEARSGARVCDPPRLVREMAFEGKIITRFTHASSRLRVASSMGTRFLTTVDATCFRGSQAGGFDLRLS
jgi:hypothetical protein